MFVRKQHAQEPKQPMVCDWNHLQLSVILTAEPTLEPGHDLESQKKTFEYDVQNATKITSALEDKHSVLQTSDIKFCRDFVCVLVSCDHFSHNVLLPFLFQRCNFVVVQFGWFLKWKMWKEYQSMWWRLLLCREKCLPTGFLFWGPNFRISKIYLPVSFPEGVIFQSGKKMSETGFIPGVPFFSQVKILYLYIFWFFCL